MSTSLSIAEAAKASGLSATTLRYYEQIGLIAPIDRQSGARRYSEADMRWLAFLVRLRATGMSMRDMQRYAELLRQGPAPASLAERQALLEDHARRVEVDMHALAETLEYIRKKIRTYKSQQAKPRRA
jgi:DNA-binding transcriptional MerR regulator